MVSGGLLDMGKVRCSYEEYLDFLKRTKWYAHADQEDTGELAYHALGLAGEGGEFVDLVKKTIRDVGYGEPLQDLPDDLYAKMQDELGDVLWYFTQLIDLLGMDMETLMYMNKTKLEAREANDGAGRQHVT